MPGFNRGKRLEILEKRREELIEEFEVINEQLSSILSASDELRLKRRLKQVNREIEEVNEEIERLTPPPIPPPPIPPSPMKKWIWILGALGLFAVIIIVAVFIYPEASRSVLPPDATSTFTPSPTSTATPSATPALVSDISDNGIDTPPLPPIEGEIITEQPTQPVCGARHPPITGPDTDSIVTIASPVFTGECFVTNQGRLLLDISWENIAPGTDLWLLVYSPIAKLYFPHYCATIQNATGGQTCLAIFGQPEPYDVIVILADAVAHADLLAIADLGSGVKHEDLPIGIREMSYISVVRTE